MQLVGSGRSQDERDTPEGRLRTLGLSTLFEGLAPQVLADVGRQSRHVTFERRATLHQQGERGTYVYVIGGGRVRLLRVGRDERELTLSYRGPGSLVGEDILLDGRFHSEARAAERVQALLVPLRVLKSMLESHAELSFALLSSVLSNTVRGERRMEALLTRPVESRVADFLSDAVELHGIPDSRGFLIGVKYTHLEIASYVGSTRETVTLVLGDLKRRGIIEVDHRRVVVRQIDKLRALV